MHIAITGASGLVGSALAAFLGTGGHRVTKLTRTCSKPSSPAGSDEFPSVLWHADTGVIDLPPGEFPQAIVHLAGENIAGSRWSAKVKQRIKESRTNPTRKLCERLAASPQRPQVLVCASAIGFYGNRGDEPLTEESAPGEGFLADVCREWGLSVGRVFPDATEAFVAEVICDDGLPAVLKLIVPRSGDAARKIG